MPHTFPPVPAWLAVPMVALALAAAATFGWLLQQRIGFLLQAPRLEGRVIERVSSRAMPSNSASKQATTRLEVVVEAGEPPTRFKTLSPLLYPLVEPGDRLTVLDVARPGWPPRHLIAHPAHLGLAPLLALLPLAILFPIVDRVMVPPRFRRLWLGLLACALVAPALVARLA